MIISNGVDSIQLLNLKYAEKEKELERCIRIFLSKLTASDMLNAKYDIDRAMLDLVQIQIDIEYIKRGWK